jgi:hypothetical protein
MVSPDDVHVLYREGGDTRPVGSGGLDSHSSTLIDVPLPFQKSFLKPPNSRVLPVSSIPIFETPRTFHFY